MRYLAVITIVVAVLNSGCRKCVECEIRLKESPEIIGFVDEFCGTNKKVEEEEGRLRSDYTCIECTVNTGLGNATSGVHCGDRAFTDSIEADWEAGAIQIGTSANCVYYRDTANVTCVLKQ